MNLRIAISAQINPDTAGGVETNIKSLLAALAHDPGGLSYRVLTHPLHHDQMCELLKPLGMEPSLWRYGQDRSKSPGPPNRGLKVRRTLGPLFDQSVFVYRALRYRQPLFASRHTIDRTLDRLGVGAVHFPSPHFFDTGKPFLYEPWDLQFKHFPEFFSAKELAWREENWRAGCERAELIITATEWVKRDIVQQLGIERAKIAVIRRDSGCASQRPTPERIAQRLEEAGIEGPFIFYPAMTFPHKNHICLFEALAELRDRRKLTVPLVMSGRRHKLHHPQVEEAIERLGLGSQVRQLGPIDEELLASLFATARFMVFPSLFEGLGLPIQEAFAHGLPVLAARESCIPEVVGDAAILFDARDPSAIAGAIEHAWQDPTSLAGLIDAGRRRLTIFSWDEAAKVTVACYKSVLGEKLFAEEQGRFREATTGLRAETAIDRLQARA